MNRQIAGLAITCLLGTVLPLRGQTNPSSNKGMQPITVRDYIEMRELGHFQAFNGSPVANFSPDGSKFIVLLRNGNVKRNTIRYSIFLWNTKKVFEAQTPYRVLTMESSSNRPAIKDVSWLADNETLVFLGERPGEKQGIFKVNVHTRQLRKITNHFNNILSYSATPDGGTVVYVAVSPE